MTAEAPRASTGSKVLGVFDFLIKLVGVGALFGIMVMLMQVNSTLSKIASGDKVMRVGVSNGGGFGPFQMETIVRTPASGSALQVNVDAGTSRSNPFFIESVG